MSDNCEFCASCRERAENEYSNWAKGDRKYYWGPEHYSNPYFREVYVERLYSKRLSDTVKSFNGIGRDNLTRLLAGKEEVTVTSVGCGPGAELMAARQVLANLGFNSRLIGIDAEPGWGKNLAVNPLIDFKAGLVGREENGTYDMEQSDVVIAAYMYYCGDYSNNNDRPSSVGGLVEYLERKTKSLLVFLDNNRINKYGSRYQQVQVNSQPDVFCYYLIK